MSKDKITIILDDRKFTWLESELVLFRNMWEQGKSVTLMAKRFKCKEIDIAMLVLDQAERKLIKSRPLGVKGGLV
ncbi:hypothetical protein [Carnobacterium inhibens]|uniref:hypothetical protein n=1 Tax=Carnobacterium inhibens TaxID=147709 RepID=UPI00203DFE66|nr:hypothetical protein [Carnobacterium inhibens]MCM3511664.1 hypothetical protein [Carnobacterium inhibens]